MEDRVLVEEALKKAQENGTKVDLAELASLLYPTATDGVANLRNLRNGRTTRISREHVLIICDYLKWDPNDLFKLREDEKA